MSPDFGFCAADVDVQGSAAAGFTLAIVVGDWSPGWFRGMMTRACTLARSLQRYPDAHVNFRLLIVRCCLLSRNQFGLRPGIKRGL